jgi:hypothetical protein
VIRSGKTLRTIYLFSKCPFQFKISASKLVAKSGLQSECIHLVAQVWAVSQLPELSAFNRARGAFFLAKEGRHLFRGSKAAAYLFSASSA